MMGVNVKGWRGWFATVLRIIAWGTIGFCSIAATATEAATITDFEPFVYDTDTPTVLRLEGEIDDHVERNLKLALLKYPEIKTISLASPGGVVVEAVSVALDIRVADLATTIPAGKKCYSACAFLFLAGTSRSAQGELGVHQVDAPNARTSQEALAYIIDILGQFDVPNEVVVKMLHTPSDRMYVLYPPEMQRLGLLGKDATTAAPEPMAVTPSVETDLSARAIAFIDSFMADWSRPNSEALPRMPQYLDSELFYFGSQLSREKVMVETAKLARSWPERNYRLVPGGAEVACTQTRCTMTTKIAWTTKAPDRGKSAGGISESQFVLQWNGYTFQIVYEDGKVIARDGVDDVYVQLAALGTQGSAAQMLEQLSLRFRPVLGGSKPFIRRVDTGDSIVPYRILVRTSNLNDAYALCNRVKSAGGDCFVRMD